MACDPFSGYIKSCSMIHGSPYIGQPKSYINRFTKTQQFYRAQALVMIHCQDDVEFAVIRAPEQRIGRERSVDMHCRKSRCGLMNCGLDIFGFFRAENSRLDRKSVV